MRDRRMRTGSVQADLHAERLTKMPRIEWPAEVERFPDAGDQAVADEIFGKILLHRAPDFWPEADVHDAAVLAVHMRMVQTNTRILMRSGPLVRSAGGNSMKPNPILQVLQHHEAAVGKLRRRLSLNMYQNTDTRTVAAAGASYREHLGNEVRVPKRRNGGKSVEVHAAVRNLIQ